MAGDLKLTPRNPGRFAEFIFFILNIVFAIQVHIIKALLLLIIGVTVTITQITLSGTLRPLAKAPPPQLKAVRLDERQLRFQH
jgi:hypothetical protein